MDIGQKLENMETIEESKFGRMETRSAPSRDNRHKYNKRITLNHFKHNTEIQKIQSSTSLTRDQAPSHKIPKAQRFATQTQNYKLNLSFLTIDLTKNIMNKSGAAFPRSNRPDHFGKVAKRGTPSPVDYSLCRFMDDVSYKNKSYQSLRQNNVSESLLRKTNSSLRGISIPKFKAYHKMLIPHSQHRFYQPQNTEANPAPNMYNPTWASKKNNLKYSIRIALKHYNQTNGSNLPGPTTYQPQKQKRAFSLNTKRTFPKSNRTYLKKFNANPAPNNYSIVRYLQKKI